MGFGDLISKLNEKNHFNKVIIDQSVIDSIIFYAKKSYPDEFLAMFDGYVKEEVLYISGLVFLGGERSPTSASFNDWLLPPNQKIWGSVHSHPGNSARPSNADLMTFSKRGPFHIIVCEPYSLETMKAYDSYGDLTSFEVGNFVDNDYEEIYNDLKEIKEEIENHYGELKPSIFDLDQDLSFFDGEDEKINKYTSELNADFEDDFDKNPLNSSSNLTMPYSRHVSDEDLGSIDLNPQVIRIGGERVNGQSPNLGIIIEFRDGKPILKSYTNDSDDEDFDNPDSNRDDDVFEE